MNVTGETPLIPIGNGLIWAKLETHNRTGSVKDRMINYIMSIALQYKNVKPGVTTIVEATSGNTGISLASYAASINCPCKIIMPKNMSSQRKDMMLAFGTAGKMREVMQKLQNTQDVDRVTFVPAPLREPGCC